MDIEELTSALRDPEHAPEPGTVLAALDRKRRHRARQQWSVAGGCLAAAAVVAAAVVVLPRTTQNTSSSSASAGSAIFAPGSSSHSAANGARAGQPQSAAGASANACTPLSLAQRAADAVRSGGSVVVADATASGLAADGRKRVVLRDVQTLRGPRIASGATGEALAGFTSGALHGQVFAIVLPAATAGGQTAEAPATGTVLAAPVSDGTVRFAGAGCWGTADISLTTVEHLVAGT
jgi:hypothetical protein